MAIRQVNDNKITEKVAEWLEHPPSLWSRKSRVPIPVSPSLALGRMEIAPLDQCEVTHICVMSPWLRVI